MNLCAGLLLLVKIPFQSLTGDLRAGQTELLHGVNYTNSLPTLTSYTEKLGKKGKSQNTQPEPNHQPAANQRHRAI